MNEALKCNDNDDNIDDDVVDDWLFIETTNTDDFEVLDPITFHEYLTWSLNKRQTIRTMVREVLMFHMAHVGLPQAQIAQKYFWPWWSPCWGCGGVQSWKIGSL